MEREQLVFVGTSDLSGHFRGKSFLLADMPDKVQRGVGLAPSNMFLSAFGSIQSTPFGTLGEVFMVPDATTRVCVPFDEGATEYFFIGDIKTFDGAPWNFCPRHLLRRALDRLQRETGFRLLAAFEQEFIYDGVPEYPAQPYQLEAYRRQEPYGERLLTTLRQAGVVPESFLAEYGPQQFEVTVAPAIGLRAADEAVITRELAQAVAFRCGRRVSFNPLPRPNGVSNGTHIHWSFLDQDNRPVLCDETQPGHLSALGSQFVAGIQHHLPALCALTTPSVASFYRLRPNGWAPTRADVHPLDRGAALRICLGPGEDAAQRARHFNVEYRVADATASPYLALAALVHAGLDGIRERRMIGRERPHALPDSLAAALTLLESCDTAADWLGAELLAAYLAFKRAEIRSLDDLDETEVCRRYADAY